MIPPLNIAMVAACPFPTSQGSQVLIRELSEALVRRGHSLHIVTYHFGEDQPCPGLTIHRIPELFRYNKFRSGPEIRKPILDLLLALKLDQVVRRHNISIIHTHNYEAPVASYPVRLLRKIPVVYHSHNTMSDEFYTYFRLKIPQVLAKWAAYLLDRFIPRRADFVIAINRQVADFLIQMGTPASKIKFIPPGIDFGSIDDPPDPSIRQRLDLGNGPLIIYAGNLDGYQRMDLLLNALPGVFKNHPTAKLVILTSSKPDQIKRDAESCGIKKNIVFVMNPDFSLVRQVLLSGSVAVNPRISWSGYPIKLLNYMAAGLPVVAFEGAAPPVENEVNGLLAPSGDTKAFGRLICDLLSRPDRAKRLGEEAVKTVALNHNWDVIATQIERIYARLLGLDPIVIERIHKRDRESVTA